MIGALARLAAIGTAGAAYVLAVRPHLQRWGATEDESLERLPGDEVVPLPRFMTTRAIDVAGPPSAVWPWLVQLGQGRAGLYGYESVERLVGPTMVSSDEIMPELQNLAVGDRVGLAPIGGADGLAMTVVQLDAPDTLVLQGSTAVSAGDYFSGGIEASWALIVREVDGGSRLLSRWRLTWVPSTAADVFHGVVVEPLHFALDEKLLRGVRDRVERSSARTVEPTPPTSESDRAPTG